MTIEMPNVKWQNVERLNIEKYPTSNASNVKKLNVERLNVEFDPMSKNWSLNLNVERANVKKKFVTYL
jgi:hypothetical protein